MHVMYPMVGVTYTQTIGSVQEGTYCHVTFPYGYTVPVSSLHSQKRKERHVHQIILSGDYYLVLLTIATYIVKA